MDYDADLYNEIKSHKEKLDDHGIRIALLEQSTKTMSESLKGILSGINRIIWFVGFGLLAFIGQLVTTYLTN